MHIWQLDPVSLTPYYDLALCRALAQAGHRVRYVTSKYLYDPGLTYPPGIETDLHYFRLLENPLLLRVPVARRALRGLLYPAGHVRLLAKMRQQRPDVVHLQWSRLPLFDHWLAAQIKQMGLPLVHTIHDVEPLFAHGPFAGRLEDVYERSVDAFIVHTEENRARFLRHYPGIAADSVHVIPMMSVDDSEPVGDRAAARAALGIDTQAFVVLFFGLVKHYKGVDVLEKAIPAILAHNRKTQVWIAGRPESEADAEILARLRTMERVHVRSEYIPAAEVWQYHVAADVAVFPYRQITQSGALATALPYGCPVIVTNVGGLPDMVQGNGWVIPPEDPAALAAAVAEAADDPAGLAAMRERSLAIAQGTLSPAVVAAQHVAIYRALGAR